jgi:GTP-binding protein
VNRLLGEDRVIVFDEPGTTRDSIYLPLERRGVKYTIIDTAGVRKRKRIEEPVEQFSVVKTLQAIEDCHVVLFILNATEDISDQDLSLLGFILESGRSLVIAANKWDSLTNPAREAFSKAVEYRASFANFAKFHRISALRGTGVSHLFGSIQQAYEAATRKIPTGKLTRLLMAAVADHPPPYVQGRRIKLRYAHTGGHLPPIIVIHGNQTEAVPASYTRYLMNYFRKALKLEGTPIRIQYKSSHNPFTL